MPKKYVILFYTRLLTNNSIKTYYFSGGVLSPGAAFSKTSLIEELNKKDVRFEVDSCSEYS